MAFDQNFEGKWEDINALKSGLEEENKQIIELYGKITALGSMISNNYQNLEIITDVLDTEYKTLETEVTELNTKLGYWLNIYQEYYDNEETNDPAYDPGDKKIAEQLYNNVTTLRNTLNKYYAQMDLQKDFLEQRYQETEEVETSSVLTNQFCPCKASYCTK